MKFLGSKLALPAISAVALLGLVGIQAMALSQTPENEVNIPAADGSSTADIPDPSVAADDSPSDGPTPIVIPEGQTTLPSDDDDEFEDEDEDDDEFEDEDEDDDFEDEDDDEDDDFEDEDD